MFEEFQGVPAHPLMVHAAVVFVPLLAVLAVAYATVPLVRPHARWALAFLALAAPGSALLAKLSGDAFFERGMARGDITAGFVPTIEAHQQLGTMTLYASIGLALVALALVFLVVPGSAASGSSAGVGSSAGGGVRKILPLALAALSVIAAVVSVYYVIRTGDSGAKAVWSGR